MAKHWHKKTKPNISPPQKTSPFQTFAIVILLILIIAGFILRNSGFHQPHLLTFDEDVYAHLGLQLKENPLNYDPGLVKAQIQSQLPPRYPMPGYLNEPFFKHPPLFPWLISISYFFKLKPFPYMSAIMVPMLLGVLTIALVFLFAKMLYDYRVGLLAAFFLTIDPLHWLCSEKIWMETTLVLFMLLALFFFFRGISHSRYLLLSGLVAGLAMLTKYTGVIVPIFIFLFALLYKEELLFKRDFWLSFIIAIAVFSPWLIWNYRVYGGLFLKHIMQVSVISKAFDRFQEYKTLMLLSSVACTFLLILRLVAPKFTPIIREKINTLFKGIKFLLPVAITIVFIAAFFYLSFRQGFKNMLIYNHLPLTGWNMGIFWKQPWCFYFTRMLELSPIYLFSFFSAIFFSFKNNQKDSLLIFSAFIMVLFFVLWKNWQSRYILPAVPILLILASRFQIWLWDRLKTQPSTTLRLKVSKLAFLAIIGYFILKTINVGIHLALSNNINYF